MDTSLTAFTKKITNRIIQNNLDAMYNAYTLVNCIFTYLYLFNTVRPRDRKYIQFNM